MYLNVYVPRLQYATGIVQYIHRQMGLPVASTVVLSPITKAFVASVHTFARQHHIPWVDFAKGQRKDDVAHEYLAAFEAAGGTEGVLCILRGRKHRTPGTFTNRVVTDGVTPSLHVQYKNAQIKQYHKEGRALRTETTINNTMDFGIRKGLTHLREL